MGKNILVVGHAFIVEANRCVWNKLGEDKEFNVDLMIPSKWKSNLVGEINLKRDKNKLSRKVNSHSNSHSNSQINNLYPVNTYFSGNGSFYFYQILKTHRILNSKKYDSIVINQEGWALSLFFINLIKLFTKNRKTKTLLMIAQNIKKDNLKWAIPLERFNLKFVTKLLGCCKETEDVVRWKGIDTPWEYFPLYYGENLESVKPIESSKKANTLCIGYIGRISQEKGIDSLLRAFSQLKQKGTDITFVVAGAGDMVDRLNQPGIEYMGILAHDEVYRFYEKIDVLILPSLTRNFWKEQFGRVIVESIASGRIVIGSNSGAIPEVLGHLGIDYIFEEGNSDAIVEQINRYQEERDNIDLESLQAKNKEMFSVDAFVQRIKGIIHEL